MIRARAVGGGRAHPGVAFRTSTASGRLPCPALASSVFAVMLLAAVSGHSGEATLANEERAPHAKPTDAADLVDELYDEAHSDLMRFLVFRIRNAAESEELAQEVYLRLLKSDRVGLLRNPRAYLFRIAANILVDRGRLEHRRIRTVEWKPEAAEQGDRAADALEQYLWRERVQLVGAAVAELPERCRRALILHRKEGWTYDRIGKELGVSRSMVKKYLRRALIACGRALDEAPKSRSASRPRERSR